MSNSLVARRYAKALFDLSTGTQSLERTDADIQLIGETLSGSHELVQFFESPIISRAKKEAVTRELFSDSISGATADFLSMLISKRREDIFPEIVSSYRELRDEQQGIVSAVAKSASVLSQEELEGLRESLQKLTGKRVRLETEIDKSLIGGVSVQIGDMVYDGSVKHQLEDLRATFQLHSSVGIN